MRLRTCHHTELQRGRGPRGSAPSGSAAGVGSNQESPQICRNAQTAPKISLTHATEMLQTKHLLPNKLEGEYELLIILMKGEY